MKKKPKILVCAPISDKKMYCFDDWMLNTSNLTYENYDIFLCDNSQDREFYNELKRRGIKCDRVSPRRNAPLQQIIAESHNKCREYAIKHKYDYILHLETDVFAPQMVIELLLMHNKKVIGGTYFIELGEQSKLMLQHMEEGRGDKLRHAYYKDDHDILDMDGEIKRVYSVGLGCVLIRRDVFSKIPFRAVAGELIYPDSFFATDCEQNKVAIYVDTNILCQHRNQPNVN